MNASVFGTWFLFVAPVHFAEKRSRTGIRTWPNMDVGDQGHELDARGVDCKCKRPGTSCLMKHTFHLLKRLRSNCPCHFGHIFLYFSGGEKSKWRILSSRVFRAAGLGGRDRARPRRRSRTIDGNPSRPEGKVRGSGRVSEDGRVFYSGDPQMVAFPLASLENPQKNAVSWKKRTRNDEAELLSSRTSR